jgi:hypothetical protein
MQRLKNERSYTSVPATYLHGEHGYAFNFTFTNGQYKNDTITGQPILLIWNSTLSSNNISLFDNSKTKKKIK